MICTKMFAQSVDLAGIVRAIADRAGMKVLCNQLMYLSMNSLRNLPIVQE